MDWKEAEAICTKEKTQLEKYYDMRFEEVETPEELIELNEYVEKREKEILQKFIDNLKGA